MRHDRKEKTEEAGRKEERRRPPDKAAPLQTKETKEITYVYIASRPRVPGLDDDLVHTDMDVHIGTAWTDPKKLKA